MKNDKKYQKINAVSMIVNFIVNDDHWTATLFLTAFLGFLIILLVLLDAAFSWVTISVMAKSVGLVEARVSEGVLGQAINRRDVAAASGLAASRRRSLEDLGHTGQIELGQALWYAKANAVGSALAVVQHTKT